jgi:hypothetical protein
VILTTPRPSSMTFAGFRSRCRTPMLWAAARPAHNWRCRLEGLVGRQTAAPTQQRRQILPVHVLHRQEGLAVGLAEVVNPADVVMRDLSSGAHLLVESRQSRRIANRPGWQELQGHGLAECEVIRAINLAHSAAAEEADDAIAAGEDRSGGSNRGRRSQMRCADASGAGDRGHRRRQQSGPACRAPTGFVWHRTGAGRAAHAQMITRLREWG